MSGSNAIPIPSRKGKGPVYGSGSVDTTPSSSSSSRSSADSNAHYGSFGSPSTSLGGSGGRRESLMSPTFSAQEHTVVNVGEEEAPRLITCVKASQGFDWNVGMFFSFLIPTLEGLWSLSFPFFCTYIKVIIPRYHSVANAPSLQRSSSPRTQTTTSTTSSADRIPWRISFLPRRR
jgi:hypothetical protein